MKTAIYVRSALNDNVISCETQIEHCKTKLQHDEEYVVYSDNGYSAHDKEKPAFNEMVSAIECGEIDTVIVYKFDRICRDIHSFCFFIDTLRQHNVTLISAVEGFDSSIFLAEPLQNICSSLPKWNEQVIASDTVKDGHVESRERRGVNGNSNLCSSVSRERKLHFLRNSNRLLQILSET